MPEEWCMNCGHAPLEIRFTKGGRLEVYCPNCQDIEPKVDGRNPFVKGVVLRDA